MSVTPSPVRVREVLDLALERPLHERPAFIAGLCGSDSRLHAEVLSLLNALDAGGDMLEPPASLPVPEAAPLTGLSFGNYKVGERIGEGGMGVVYRAEDTRLGRSVAVKALPPNLARDAHRRARFEHEARILASLTHPSIAAIHGVEETARGPVLVLEFVPGETLAARLARGRIPVEEALSIAIAVARGLEAAHAAGVVHRDLKPSNIQLTPEGSVKILDFGVAKQVRVGVDPGQTWEGQLIGTAGYMSPEQARGKVVDRRADLWALGCVLFEMVAGSRAFDGETASDTVAAVLRAEPDWSRLPGDTPPRVIRILRRCLQKDPDLRQRDAGDVAIELSSPESVDVEGTRPGKPKARSIAIGVLLFASALMVTLWAARGKGTSRAPAAPVRFELHLKPQQSAYITPGGAMAISPDGRTLVFCGGPADRTRLYSRQMDSSEVVELEGTVDGLDPCFSPDSRWIAFRSGQQIKRIPVAGGGPEVLVPSDVAMYGLAWDDNGLIYTGGKPFGVRRLSPDGKSTLLLAFDANREVALMHPEPLDGGTFLATQLKSSRDGSEPTIIACRGEERVIVVSNATCARFLLPNHLVFWQSGALMTAPFDTKLLRLTDAPSVVIKPVAGGEPSHPPRFAVSRTGVLAWLPGNIRYDHTRLAWREPDGSWTDVTQADPSIDAPRLSPDGSRIAMLIGRASGDVWMLDLHRGNKFPLTTGDNHHFPMWTPDGKSLIYGSSSPERGVQLERIVADGSSAPEILWQAEPQTWAYPTGVTPDGRLLLSLDEGRGLIDLFTFDPRTRETPQRLMPTAGHRYGARLSPDGGWIAYTSEESGSMEVYLHRFPSLEPKLGVSTGGGYRPVWSGDGKKLFYMYLDRVFVVDVAMQDGKVAVSPPRVVAEHLLDARFDVDHEGKRLLMARPSGDAGPQSRIEVMTGWSPTRR